MHKERVEPVAMPTCLRVLSLRQVLLERGAEARDPLGQWLPGRRWTRPSSSICWKCSVTVCSTGR